ncbi:MAG: hypothetical protein WCQ90_15825, partial [Deltaproteobacteria bacterium]
EHKFNMDYQKEFKGTAGGVFLEGNDLTGLSDRQIAWVMGTSSAKTAMEDFNKAVGAGRNLNRGTGYKQGDKGQTPSPPSETKTVSPKAPQKNKPLRAEGR